MKNYVLGFYFLPGQKVVMIEHDNGSWQDGLLNGIGGSIEDQDGGDASKAMEREFKEETGLDVSDWNFIASVGGNGWEMFVFWAEGAEPPSMSRNDEGVIHICELPMLPENTEHVARWCCGLAFDLLNQRVSFIST